MISLSIRRVLEEESKNILHMWTEYPSGLDTKEIHAPIELESLGSKRGLSEVKRGLNQERLR